jgi:F0F1-type ATP synthase membrane subunit c/vacuolar-type H+-ATPase subunit K
MKTAISTLQIMRIAMLSSIAIYVLIVKQLPSSIQANPVIYYAMVFLAVWVVVGVFFLQQKFVKASESVLTTNPDDVAAQKRWRAGYLLIYAFSDAIALYGVVLHFVGFTMTQVAPFLIAGFLLIVFYSPRIPVPSRG